MFCLLPFSDAIVSINMYLVLAVIDVGYWMIIAIWNTVYIQNYSWYLINNNIVSIRLLALFQLRWAPKRNQERDHCDQKNTSIGPLQLTLFLKRFRMYYLQISDSEPCAKSSLHFEYGWNTDQEFGPDRKNTTDSPHFQ